MGCLHEEGFNVFKLPFRNFAPDDPPVAAFRLQSAAP